MFVPLTSTKDPNYTRRRKYVTDRVENGVDAEVGQKGVLVVVVCYSVSCMCECACAYACVRVCARALFCSCFSVDTFRSARLLLILLRRKQRSTSLKHGHKWSSRTSFASRKIHNQPVYQSVRLQSIMVAVATIFLDVNGSLQDVKKIAQLLHSGAPQEELERAVVNGVNRRFYGADVPEDVVDVSTWACLP